MGVFSVTIGRLIHLCVHWHCVQLDSFPEIAFCEEQIFGTDIDVLGWDFGYVETIDFWEELLFTRLKIYSRQTDIGTLLLE